MSIEIITALVFCAAYMVGAFPTGYWLARWHGIDDIRQYGSGNIGATNVARALGWKYFFVVLFIDSFKAYAFLVICRFFFEQPLLSFFAMGLLIGNGFSIFLRGSGGKGVSTMVGIILALHPLLFIGIFAIWIAALLFTRVVGMASVITMVALPWYALLISDLYGLGLIIFISSWILWKHRENIRSFYYARY